MKKNDNKKIKIKELKNKSEKYQKNTKHFSEGISLITLIITIVLLIVLVGTSINFIVDDKLYDEATNAVNETKEHIEEQQQMTNEVRNLYR